MMSKFENLICEKSTYSSIIENYYDVFLIFINTFKQTYYKMYWLFMTNIMKSIYKILMTKNKFWIETKIVVIYCFEALCMERK